MIINPIIPIWLMSIICILFLFMKRKGKLAFVRLLIMVILLFVINLRIMVPDGNVIVKTQKMNTKVLFVIDDTISMVAKDDGQKERLESVREDCGHILEELNGAKFAVITFNNDVHFLSPFNNNFEYVKSVIDAIYPIGELYANGSSMNIWKDTAKDVLKDAKEGGNGDVVLFFISDGEITSQEQLGNFSELKQYIDYGAVLGYGTETGGQMEVKDLFTDEPKVIEDKRDYKYEPAISKIDEGNLKSIAKDVGVDYIHMEKSSDVDGILKQIKANAKTEDSDKKEEGHKDIYYIFVVPFVALLIWEIIDTRKRVKVI